MMLGEYLAAASSPQDIVHQIRAAATAAGEPPETPPVTSSWMRQELHSLPDPRTPIDKVSAIDPLLRSFERLDAGDIRREMGRLKTASQNPFDDKTRLLHQHTATLTAHSDMKKRVSPLSPALQINPNMYTQFAEYLER